MNEFLYVVVTFSNIAYCIESLWSFYFLDGSDIEHLVLFFFLSSLHPFPSMLPPTHHPNMFCPYDPSRYVRAAPIGWMLTWGSKVTSWFEPTTQPVRLLHRMKVGVTAWFFPRLTTGKGRDEMMIGREPVLCVAFSTAEYGLNRTTNNLTLNDTFEMGFNVDL